MSPLIKKEIRLLLPAWVAAMLLGIVPAWFSGIAWNLDYTTNLAESSFLLEGLVPLIFALGILFLGISPFGQEFSQGTFTVLLSQPAERSRVWRTKISILAMAFFIVWAAALASIWCQYYLYDYLHPLPLKFGNPALLRDHPVYFNEHYRRFSGAFDYAFIFLTISVLVVFSGGLWTTLLLRQVTNAFWFTLLTPLAIILGISSWLSDRLASDESISKIIIVALAIYSVAGYFVAALLFRRCQDLQSAGGEVTFSWFKKFAGSGTSSRARAISFRPRHWFSALVWKEIELHQVNILLAALLLLLHLSSFITRKIHPHFSNPNLQFVLEGIWLLWLLMPILIGCAAIAEERRLGVIESQLTLPVSRRVQLFIKFSIGLILSLLLGAAMPLLLEGTKDLNDWLFALAGGMFFISFYASSMARTVLQAIGLAVVAGAVLLYCEIINAIDVYNSFFQHNSFGPPEHYGLDLLKVFLGLPLLLLALIWLIFWNYKQLRQNTALLLTNLLAILAVFVVVYPLSYAVYYRAWEYFTPTLPLRGPAQLSDSSRVRFAGSAGAVYATLPDGKLWVLTHTYHLYSPVGYGVSFKTQSAFVPGTNWTQAAADGFQAVGIRSDGSLWSIQRPWVASHKWIEQKGPFILAQIGSDTNWSQAAGGHLGFLLLKKDGSLWVWGTNAPAWTHFQSSVPNKLKSDLATLPSRFSDDTNWTQLYSSDVEAYAMNDNGEVWNWMAWIGTNDVSLQFRGEFATNGPWLSFTPVGNSSYIAVKTNGTLLIVGNRVVIVNRKHETVTYLPEENAHPLGKGTKWKAAVSANWGEIMAIRSDGTLWEWNVPDLKILNFKQFVQPQPVQLGTHSDWIAVLPGLQGLALASDGSLWAWDRPSMYPWLAPSRKPAYMGNILEGTPASP
jgi:hypothetical protein